MRKTTIVLSLVLLTGIAATPSIHAAGGLLPQAPPGFFPAPATDADYYENGAFDPAKVELGKLLFHDKTLSGNLNTSCATCHHALADTGDGLSLPIGEGGRGLGVTRDTGELSGTPVVERVPRNAPHVFNLGVHHIDKLFHDGRVALDPTQPSGFMSPAGDDLPLGLDNVLAVQAMFPVTSATEMAGQSGENPIADMAAAGDLVGLWDRLAMRLRTYPGYVDRFIDVFDDVNTADDLTYVHAANAIGAFEATAWRSDDSPFDRYLRGDLNGMSPIALKGASLFYGKAGCSDCHSGIFQTDVEFHAIAMPQIGPGKGDGFMNHDDFGREQVTGDEADRYKFRTPTLRNVALTGPWGHAGAYDDLEAVVRHHLSPVESIFAYDTSQAVLPSRDDLDAIDFVIQNDMDSVVAIAGSSELAAQSLSDLQVDAIVKFLQALTDPSMIDLRSDVPMSLPSGEPLAE